MSDGAVKQDRGVQHFGRYEQTRSTIFCLQKQDFGSDATMTHQRHNRVHE